MALAWKPKQSVYDLAAGPTKSEIIFMGSTLRNMANAAAKIKVPIPILIQLNEGLHNGAAIWTIWPFSALNPMRPASIFMT